MKRPRPGSIVRLRVQRGRRITAKLNNVTRRTDDSCWVFYTRVDGKEKGSCVLSVSELEQMEVLARTTNRQSQSAHDRFWGKVDKGDGSGCWIWTGRRVNSRYGMFKMDGKSMHASRASYILANGPIDAKILVCHRCDNPPCVRPDHLFLGTSYDNLMDAFQKGRLPGRPSILTPDQHADIRQRRAIGDSLTVLAKAFAVSRAAIVKICKPR